MVKYGNDPYFNAINEKFIDRVQDIYLNKNQGYKGAIVFITDKGYNNPSAGGSQQAFSKTDPLRYQSLMVFDKGLNENDVYAHVLAHMLGVEHSFIENEDNGEIAENTDSRNTPRNINDAKTYWNKQISDVEQTRIDNEEELAKLEAKKNPTNPDKESITQLKAILKSSSGTTYYEDKIRNIDMFKGGEFKVSKKNTLNFMDYDIVRTYFSKNQAIIAKKECKDFYQ